MLEKPTWRGTGNSLGLRMVFRTQRQSLVIQQKPGAHSDTDEENKFYQQLECP